MEILLLRIVYPRCTGPFILLSYKALAAIINLRNEYKGLLTNVDIEELESYPSETEIYVYIGSKKLEHSDAAL